MSREIHWRTLFFALWIVATFMALAPRPPHLPIDRFGDKFEHILAFTALAFSARLGFHGTSDRLILERLSFVGAMIEVLQAIPALRRDCDWRDWLADTLAVAATLFVMRAMSWFRRATARAD